MKERIKNFMLALVVYVGILVIGFSAKILLPTWAFYSLLGVCLIWILYDVSKPDKKKEHYWLFTYMDNVNGRISIGNGTQQTKEDEFDFCLFFSKCPKGYILNIEEISKTQYDKLNDVINKRNTEATE